MHDKRVSECVDLTQMMEFNLKKSNAVAHDLLDMSDAESIVKLEPTLGVEYRTPEKSHTLPTSGPSFTEEYDNINLRLAFATPQKSWSIPFCGSSYTPLCDDSLKPAVGMTFDNIESAKEFYRAYAAYVGFPVRVGQHKTKDGVVTHKRLYCSREGFRKPKNETQSEPDCSEKKRCEKKITRCGCLAMVALKRTKESKYVITTFVEEHTHALVSPNKQHLIRSNREVGNKVKNTLFSFHKSSIGTSDAYRFLRVGLGGFENVGCTLRDLQNYHGKLRCLIRSSDAQMFVDQLSRKALANPAFYFDYIIDENGKLVHAFWADATCRKNCSHFGDLVSFDSTYSTNEYNMIFTPFTGVNHHKQNVLFGAALLSNEKIESYTWLFKTFLKAMGGAEPNVIITDEDASMKVAIQNVFLKSIHRLCMLLILKKVPEKVGPDLNEDDEFHESLRLCVWSSETPEEFEERWSRIMIRYGLQNHEWFVGRFDIRSSWVPAYFRDIALSGLLRTTSRSESVNSYFSRFIGFKHALVEFWLRFDTALEDQRHKELEADNVTLHTNPVLKTSWGMEKHASEIFTHEVFGEFQQELLAAREYCSFESMQQDGELKIMKVADNSRKIRVVQLNTSTMFASCSCMRFETHDIPCHHVIHALRSAKIDELPSIYVLKRFRKDCKKESVLSPDGILLEERANSPVNPLLQKLISETSNKMESLLVQSKNSLDVMQVLRDGIFALGDRIREMIPAKEVNKIEEFEEFLGCPIPMQVDIHPPNDIRSKGRIKRIKGHADKGRQQNKNEQRKKNVLQPRRCSACKKIAFHDRRTCPKQAKQ